jgi:hypothetical protein
MGKNREEWTASDVEAQLSPKLPQKPAEPDGGHSPDINIHPWDSTVNLSVHQPLYPPGRIVHLVRHYQKPGLIDDS